VQALAEARATDVLLAIPAASDIDDPAAMLAATVGPTGLEPVPAIRAWGQWLLRTRPQLAEAVPVRHETVRLTSLAAVPLSAPRVRLEAGTRPRVTSADGATTYSDGEDYALAAVPVALHSPRREPPPRTSLSRTAKGRIPARASVLVDYDTVADAPACPADPAFTDAVWEEIRRGRGTLKTRYVAVEYGRTLQAGKDFRCERAGKRTVDLILETTRDLALRARQWDDEMKLIVRAAEVFAGEPDDRRLARVPFNVVLLAAPGSPGAERLGRLGHAVLALDPHPGQTTEEAVSLAEALTAKGANCLGVLGVLSYPRPPGLEGVIGRAAWLGSRAPTGER
jgi:hypothetical protein